MSVWEEAKHPRSKDGKFGHANWASKLSDAIGGEPLKGDEAYKSVVNADDLPNADAKAIEAYSGGSFASINKYHRRGPDSVAAPGRPIIKRHSDALDAMFKATPPLKQDIHVLRGVDYSDDMFGGVGSRVGKVFHDKGYVSTTTDKIVQNGFSWGDGSAHITIKVPAGSHVMRIAYHGDDQEREILLPRGSRFKIISDVMGEKNVRQLELEFLT